MNANVAEKAPAMDETTVVDDAHASSPAVKLATVALAIFVLYFGLGGLLTRVEPEELSAAVAVDVLVGVSVVSLLAINSGIRTAGRLAVKRLILAFVLGVACSGVLIGWHCLTVHLRLRATEVHQMSLSRSLAVPKYHPLLLGT